MNLLKFQDNKSILLSESMLSTCMPNHLTIRLPKRNVQIIRGFVYTALQRPCEGAVVEVTQISEDECSRTVLGFALTDNNGEYVIAIKTKFEAIYELEVYLPLDS